MANQRVLTNLDEWPRHQTLDTFNTILSSDPGWSDGYWDCIGDPNGEVNLITAIRVYANTNVIDAYAMATTDDGKQYNLRASRRLRPDIDGITVGPFGKDIIDGHRKYRLTCDENPHDISFDILWEGVSPPYDEAPGTRFYADGRLVVERSNYIQAGDLSGSLKVGDREWKFDVADGWAGARDHSWGTGNTGMGEKPNPFGAPPLTGGRRGLRAGMRTWVVARFQDRLLYYSFLVSPDGTISSAGTGGQETGQIHSWVDYRYDSGKEGWSYTGVEVPEMNWVDGWPRLDNMIIHFSRPDGGVDRFNVKNVSKAVYMQGGGYWGGWDDGLGRGAYRGEEKVEGEIWDVSHPVIVMDESGKNEVRQRPGGSYAENYATLTNLDDPSDVGLGILEAIVVGDEFPGVEHTGPGFTRGYD